MSAEFVKLDFMVILKIKSYLSVVNIDVKTWSC